MSGVVTDFDGILEFIKKRQGGYVLQFEDISPTLDMTSKDAVMSSRSLFFSGIPVYGP